MTTSTDLRADGRAARAQASRWLLAVGIAGSALAVGTVHTVTLCVVTVVLAAAAVLGWWGAEPMRARSAATVLLLTGVGLTAYTALQCVPMPIGWLAAIAPHNADVWSRALAPLHEEGPRWAPISLDPIATRVEVLKGVAYLLAFVTALRVARRKEGVGFLSAVIVATGVALALAAVLHPAFGERKLFGLFEPGSRIPDRHIAPLMNPNQLAAYLNVAFCLALASALSPEPRVPRVIAIAIALVLVGVQLWVASRGGVVSMVLGGILTVALARAGRAKEAARQIPVTVFAAVAAVAGVVMLVMSSEEVSGELLSADVSKKELFGQAMRMVPAYPLFGAGRGSFASTFPRFRDVFAHMDLSQGYLTFTHPENIVAQWTTEWGVPIAVVGFLAIAWALRPTAAIARSALAAGAWAAVVATAVHNATDFSSEVPGIVIAVVVCTAIVTGGTAGRTSELWLGRWSLAPSAIAAAGGAAAVLSLVACWVERGRELGDDEQALYQASVAHPHPLADDEQLARAAMLRHPAEPYLPFAVSLRASRERGSSAIAWLSATLERAPLYGPAHLILARLLGTRSPSQARLEYRLAMEQAPELIAVVTAEAPAKVDSYWDAEELVPSGRSAVSVLTRLVGRLADRLPATCTRLDAEIAAKAPSQPGPAQDSAMAQVLDLEAQGTASWCEGALRDSCVQNAMAASLAAERLNPRECLPHELRARVRVAAGDTRGALDDLSSDADGVEDRVPCLERLAWLALREKDDARADAALAKVEAAGCADDDECVRNLSWAASVEEARGRPATAMSLFRRAHDRAPDRDELLQQLAGSAAKAGLHLEAAGDYERLAQRHPEETRWKRAAEVERDAAMRGSIPR